jgi:hypothetical protein
MIYVQEEPFGVVEDVMYATKFFSVNIHSDLFAQVGPATLNLRVCASGDYVLFVPIVSRRNVSTTIG